MAEDLEIQTLGDSNRIALVKRLEGDVDAEVLTEAFQSVLNTKKEGCESIDYIFDFREVKNFPNFSQLKPAFDVFGDMEGKFVYLLIDESQKVTKNLLGLSFQKINVKAGFYSDEEDLMSKVYYRRGVDYATGRNLHDVQQNGLDEGAMEV